MNIALARHAARVAELPRGRVNSVQDVFTRLTYGRGHASVAQCRRGDQRAAPGAKVLRCQLMTSQLVKVTVDVSRFYRSDMTVCIGVLEQALARQMLTPLDHRGQTLVDELDVVVFGALATEVKANPRSREFDVLAQHGRQPERLVPTHVLVVADADQCGLEQTHHNGQYLFLRQALPREVMLRTLPDPRQRFAERDHALELGLVAYGAPQGMVAVLLATLRVFTGGLDVRQRIGRDPDVRPGRWDRQRMNADQRLRISDCVSIGVNVLEVLSRTRPAYAGFVAADVMQASIGGGTGAHKGVLSF